jgi:glycosyltransferase involved in cell wall biosynthesis
MAYELNMVSKHSTEKQAAHLSDCFTTVSKITARECEQLLDIKVDVVTPNGFEDDFVPSAKTFGQKRNEAREALRKVAETLTNDKLDEEVLFVGTGGRYEYKNKGIDVFIESLKHVNDKPGHGKQVVAFIMVPAWTKNHRDDLASCLHHDICKLPFENKITTHDLHDYYNDPVMSSLDWFHLQNNSNDRVKVIFVPAYLNGNDGIFNKKYYELLIGFDLTVFPSYYEPWGYTPLESVAFHVPTITTDLSGFGEWVSDKPQDISNGVGIIHRSDYNGWEVAFKIAEMIQKMSQYSEASLKSVRKKAANIAQNALWEHFIQYYEEAYHIALSKKNKR